MYKVTVCEFHTLAWSKRPKIPELEKMAQPSLKVEAIDDRLKQFESLLLNKVVTIIEQAFKKTTIPAQNDQSVEQPDQE